MRDIEVMDHSPAAAKFSQYFITELDAAGGTGSVAAFESELPQASEPAAGSREIQPEARVCEGPKTAPRSRNYAWADLMRRVFSTDVLVCECCGGPMRILSAIHPPETTQNILGCLGLPIRPPPVAGAAADPETEIEQP